MYSVLGGWGWLYFRGVEQTFWLHNMNKGGRQFVKS